MVNGSEDEGLNHSFKYDSMTHYIPSQTSITRWPAFTGSPGKKSRLEPREKPSDPVEEIEMEVQEGEKEEPQEADMDCGEDSSPPRSHRTSLPATYKGETCKCSRLSQDFLTFSFFKRFNDQNGKDVLDPDVL